VTTKGIRNWGKKENKKEAKGNKNWGKKFKGKKHQ
jgi:hypothetical protein